MHPLGAHLIFWLVAPRQLLLLCDPYFTALHGRVGFGNPLVTVFLLIY